MRPESALSTSKLCTLSRPALCLCYVVQVINEIRFVIADINKPVFYFLSSAFSKTVTRTSSVDKTLLMETILRCSDGVLITLSRRFGRYTNMDII
jgi:hypothetical protein